MWLWQVIKCKCNLSFLLLSAHTGLCPNIQSPGRIAIHGRAAHWLSDIYPWHFKRDIVEFSSKVGKVSPEFGDKGYDLVVRPLTEARIGLWLNLPGVDNRQYYETGYDSAYGAYKSAGKCCCLKEKAESKSSKQGCDPSIMTR